MVSHCKPIITTELYKGLCLNIQNLGNWGIKRKEVNADFSEFSHHGIFKT